MTPISIIIENLQSLKNGDSPYISDFRLSFLSPTLHVDLIDQKFQGYNDDDRLSLVEQALIDLGKNSNESLTEVMRRLPVLINALTPEEAKNKASWLGSNSSSSWVNWFLKIPNNRETSPEPATNYIHFYGYKGGQARSTILSLLAKLLADDGYKILVIDADTEAPSLDALLGTQADYFSQTLMGLCGWAEEFQPIPGAYIGQSGDGRIDVLPCRPKTEEHDLDFALLVATAPLDSRIYEKAAKNLQKQIIRMKDPYDFVLLDHRTGIATSVLPLIAELPGSTAIFARTDANTISVPSEMRKVISSILKNSGDGIGAFISFTLDSNRKSSTAIPLHEAATREILLETLADSIDRTNNSKFKKHLSDKEEEEEEDADELSPQELAFNWVEWYLDRSLLDSTLPSVQKLQADNIAALQKLRGVLGLPIQKKSTTDIRTEEKIGNVNLSVSGAKDQGAFIHIPDIERLFTKGSPLTYILGRKGTGKTRLLRELARRTLGTPILVAADEPDFTALRSQSAEAQAWVRITQNPETFWWSLIRIAVEDSNNLTQNVSNKASSGEDPSTLSDPLELKKIVSQSDNQRVFLIDGLETLVPAAKTSEYVAGLFSVMSIIQNDPTLSSKLVIRAFLREDLTADSIQNIEQQMEGRVLRLKWSAVSILNFALSRLPSLPWISKNFKDVSTKIIDKSKQIQRSGLSEQEATELLLMVFPNKIRRNNLLTQTFLRLYFSDAGGDDTNTATFYPRLYLSFLQTLDNLAQKDSAPIENGRLNSSLLNKAYDQASAAFIDETKQELVHLLSLNQAVPSGNKINDQASVTLFISAFDGMSTPFDMDKLVIALTDKTPFTDQSIRDSLRRMKALRMFEDRPGYPGWWRVGQLYKMGLRMKYAR